MLGSGETVFFTATGALLVGEGRGPGHWQGASTGVTISVGSLQGRSVRYRVGATRGHYVQGEATPTAIDSGTLWLTNTRVIFQGRKQTRECQFSKLIGFQHFEGEGSTTFSVSNREKPTTVRNGLKVAPAFDFRLDLALAHFRGTVEDLVGKLEKELDEIEASRHVAPVNAASWSERPMRGDQYGAGRTGRLLLLMLELCIHGVS